MTLKLWRVIFIAIVAFVLCSSLVFSQGRSFWITVKDDYSAQDSAYLTFGNFPSATYGIDSLTASCKEAGAPPLPPAGFDSRWFNIPGRVNSWDLGLLALDYRSLTSVSGKDTFLVSTVNTDGAALDANFTFAWPSSAYLAARCDSMFLVDPTGLLIAGGKVNMFTQQSVLITDPGGTLGSANFKLRIYVYGSQYPDANPCVISGVDLQQTSPIPQSFALHQNYPNPFNPTTTITFDIQKTSVADLSIYNILGQKVATLHSGLLAPGSYSAVWDGTSDNGISLSSGVYFVRMNARTENGQQFTGLRKLLFMK